MFTQQTLTAPDSSRSVTLKRGNVAKAAIASALRTNGLWDAFEFTSKTGHTIRVERANLKTYGMHYRVHYWNKTYILPYSGLMERLEAVLWIKDYLLPRVQWHTLKRKPDQALTFTQERKSDRVVL